MEDNTSRIRDQDWMFNAIWVAAGDSRVPKCTINIPTTAIFRDGLPFKCVECSKVSGNVERLDLDDDRFSERELGENAVFKGSKDRRLRALRKVLLEFSDDNQYILAQKSAVEPFICKVSIFLALYQN